MFEKAGEIDIAKKLQPQKLAVFPELIPRFFSLACKLMFFKESIDNALRLIPSKGDPHGHYRRN